MPKYRKKPIVIEAVQWLGRNIDEVQLTLGIEEVQQELGSDKLIIPTLEGNMTASNGDYIIKGIKGEFYPCKPDIFEDSYEEVCSKCDGDGFVVDRVCCGNGKTECCGEFEVVQENCPKCTALQQE